MSEWFLVKRHINKNGYDASGMYYGTGNPVFIAESQGESRHTNRIEVFRASSIACAREIVRERFDPVASFVK